MIKKIYLHWTAGRYDQLFDDYHICIDGDGVIHRMGDLEEKKAHTWMRNTGAVGIALCCCYGARIQGVGRKAEGVGREECFRIDWGFYPPTEPQILAMARCVAEICREYDLPIDKETVMTHAEVADIDGYGIYDNDPDLRWDLLRLYPEGNVPGGDVIRSLAKILWRKEVKEYGTE